MSTNTKVREAAPTPPGQVDRRQDDVQQALRDVRGLSLLNGVFVTATLASGTTAVSHGLGRKPKGIIATRKPASTLDFYWESPTKTKVDIVTLAPGEWTFWVF